jgi:Protein of unknown function (DUF2934)
VIDRAAEQAAIDAHIAARGVTHLPEADPVARAIELWRAEKLEPRGMRKTVAGRVKRAKRRATSRTRKEVMQHTGPPTDEPADNAMAPAVPAAGADLPDTEGDHMGMMIRPKPSTTATASMAPNKAVWQDYIAKLAYSLWEREGRPAGQDLHHWFTAKAFLSHQPWPPPCDALLSFPLRFSRARFWAYALWEMEGRPHGEDLRHWLTAEAIVAAILDG